MKLKIEDLAVDSFATTMTPAERGTVIGAQYGSYHSEIYGTCETCVDMPTCFAATCAETCPATCRYSCGCITEGAGGGGTGTSVETCQGPACDGGGTSTAVYPCGTGTA